MKSALLLAGLCLLAIGAGSACAQTVVRANVTEDFAPSVRVSGNVLVGVAVGSLAGSADPRKVVVPGMIDAGGNSLCFTAKTRDGQYLAEAQLPKQDVPTVDFILQPDGDWKHLSELRAYSFADFAALVRIGDDCATNPHAPISPVRYPAAGPVTLTIFVNSQRSLSATVGLKWGDGRAAVGPCVKADATRIRSAAFDMVCSVPLPAAPQGAAELSVMRRARLGPAIDTFALALPAVMGAALGN